MKPLLNKTTSEPNEEQHLSLLEFIKGYFIFLYRHFIRP